MDAVIVNFLISHKCLVGLVCNQEEMVWRKPFEENIVKFSSAESCEEEGRTIDVREKRRACCKALQQVSLNKSQREMSGKFCKVTSVTEKRRPTQLPPWDYGNFLLHSVTILNWKKQRKPFWIG